jgi:tripartite-type tricarboxylate transporter receptor subunit TctC
MKRLSVAAVGLMLTVTGALAQTYPSRPVKMLVSFPPGSSTDQVARLLASELQMALGQPFIIENRVGGQGSVSADAVAKSAQDGYTLLLTTNSLAVTPSLFSKLPYDPIKDIAPVARIGFTAFVAMVRPDFKAQSMAELLAIAKAEPGKLSGGQGGSGGQVSVALLKSLAQVDILSVPYKGVPQAIIDVLGGQIDFAFIDLGNAAAQTRGGKLRALGVTLPNRTDLAPGVPTIGETVPGFEVTAWFALVAPAGTPPEIINKLYDATAAALAKPSVKQGIASTGTDVAPMGPAQFPEFLRSEIAKWKVLVKLADLHAE